MTMTHQLLLSVPPGAVSQVRDLAPGLDEDAFVGHDPPGGRLGSGGGTAHLLLEAWRDDGGSEDFDNWLQARLRVMVHAGGLSRRSPEYAPAGKVFTPLPVWRWATGQRLDQVLLDRQRPFVERVLRRAPGRSVLALSSGDVLLFADDDLPALPDVDVMCLGLWVRADQASHFGVFFCSREEPETLAFMRQKPSPEEIRELEQTHLFLVDTGLWLLSARAIRVLLTRCGCPDPDAPGASVSAYDLYGAFGPALGSEPTVDDPDVADLSVGIVPLPGGRFFHFGTSRDLVASTSEIQNLVLDQRQFSPVSSKPHPAMCTQNAVVGYPLHTENDTLWIENAHVPNAWTLTREHIITGVPENRWALSLPPGVCLDLVPLDGGQSWCIRPYGIDDPFRGACGTADTVWMGRPLRDWFAERRLEPAACGVTPEADIHDAPLFPVVPAESLCGGMVQWMVGGPAVPPEETSADSPPVNQPVEEEADVDPLTAEAPPANLALWYQNTEKLSARGLAERADLGAVSRRRASLRRRILPDLARHAGRSVFYRLDLAATARDYVEGGLELPPAPAPAADPVVRSRDAAFRAAVCRRRGSGDADGHEARAFRALADAIIDGVAQRPAVPRSDVLPDQIVWGRCPVRLDLAGGWTDTPPYCLQYGGRVVNVAVDLNGQPPIQVFARVTDTPRIVLRSIDLGDAETIDSFEALSRPPAVGDSFAIARTALCLAGFLPRFQGREASSLERLLTEFGGGLELSLLAAVPKGSGLGTSSILTATVLGTLSDLAGLHWEDAEIIRRTLAVEQILTTGGGWQDQAGGILPGIKRVQTRPGFEQSVAARWLPERLLQEANSSILLYYTGLRRVARGILREIVRGMFLNSGSHLRLLREIGQNADVTFEAMQRGDHEALCRAVARSWELNCALDAGTDPPAVRQVLAGVADYLAGAKLLGAGGGGYLLMFAKGDDAAQRIRDHLTRHPPNDAARFVDVAVSPTGLQVTRS